MAKKSESKEKNFDGYYTRALNLMVDSIFEVAARKQWTWEEIAERSGLSSNTVHRLGERTTKYPQYRTVELLARAVGGRLIYRSGAHGETQQVKLKLKTWDLGGRRKSKVA